MIFFIPKKVCLTLAGFFWPWLAWWSLVYVRKICTNFIQWLLDNVKSKLYDFIPCKDLNTMFSWFCFQGDTIWHYLETVVWCGCTKSWNLLGHPLYLNIVNTKKRKTGDVASVFSLVKYLYDTSSCSADDMIYSYNHTHL